MKYLIQRVRKSSVTVKDKKISEIKSGILAFVGLEKKDELSDIYNITDKLITYRIFEDDKGRMNRSLLDIQGELLLVSQFTLAANTKKGRRPGFDLAMEPERAEKMYNNIIEYIKGKYNIKVKTGIFGADMQVALVNDGPVTFILESK